jgi:hypothetical protein
MSDLSRGPVARAFAERSVNQSTRLSTAFVGNLMRPSWPAGSGRFAGHSRFFTPVTGLGWATALGFLSVWPARSCAPRVAMLLLRWRLTRKVLTQLVLLAMES